MVTKVGFKSDLSSTTKFDQIHNNDLALESGAMTFSITTLSITTFCITTFSIMTFSITLK